MHRALRARLALALCAVLRPARPRAPPSPHAPSIQSAVFVRSPPLIFHSLAAVVALNPLSNPNPSGCTPSMVVHLRRLPRQPLPALLSRRSPSLNAPARCRRLLPLISGARLSPRPVQYPPIESSRQDGRGRRMGRRRRQARSAASMQCCACRACPASTPQVWVVLKHNQVRGGVSRGGPRLAPREGGAGQAQKEGGGVLAAPPLPPWAAKPARVLRHAAPHAPCPLPSMCHFPAPSGWAAALLIRRATCPGGPPSGTAAAAARPG